jgi:hypothetical protein
MRYWLVLACLVFIAVLPGCRSHQLRHDQGQMRRAVLDLYTDQLMDNLIRAYVGMPLVHMDYTSMTGTITQDASGSAGDQQTLETQRNDLGLTTLRRFVRATSFGAAAAQKTQLTMTANPVLNNNEVYNAYLEFANNKKGWFVVTDAAPPPGAAHISRCSSLGCCEGGKRYYWVPCEHRHEFLRLALVTTVQRGQPLSTPESFENTVVSVEDAGKPVGYSIVHLRKKIPNGSGTLTATLGGNPYVLGFEKWPETRQIDGETYKSGQKIDRLLLKIPVDPETKKVIRSQGEKDVVGDLTLDDFKKRLEGQTVSIDLNHFKPTIPTTEDLIQAIRHETGLIRLDQVGR